VTDLQDILLGLLSRHCRGPASARKAWKIIEDLHALGLDVGRQAILDALADLRGQGFPVVATGGDVAALYLDDRRRERGRSDWRTGRRPRRMARAVHPSAEARLLAEAERFYARLLADALARAQAAVPAADSLAGAAEARRGRSCAARDVSALGRRAACGRRRGPRRAGAGKGMR
jgi:hypothetical protein